MLISVFALRIPSIMLLVISAASVAHAQDATAPQAAPKKLKITKQSLGKTRPVHAFGDLYFAGQPTPDDIPLFKQRGIKTVITLRKSSEVPWDEAGAVKQQGMNFVQIPFQKPEELTPKVFDKALKVLRNKKRGPTVLHCGSSNRVGAIWYTHRVLDANLTHDAALQEAKAVGLRTMAYIERAKSYIDAARKKHKTPQKTMPVKNQ